MSILMRHLFTCIVNTFDLYPPEVTLIFMFQDDTFAVCLKDDKSTKHGLSQLLKNIETMSSQANSMGAKNPQVQQKIPL